MNTKASNSLSLSGVENNINNSIVKLLLQDLRTGSALRFLKDFRRLHQAMLRARSRSLKSVANAPSPGFSLAEAGRCGGG
jgi:hypothetical protein